MKHLGFFDPFCDSGGDRRHGENHGGELLVKSKGGLVNEGNVVGDTCLGSEVLEVSDVFLESIVHDAIRAFERSLGELGELKVGGCFGIIGKNVDSKLDVNLSEVFLELAIEVSAILSYHISEKETLCPLLILLSMVMTLSLSEV